MKKDNQDIIDELTATHETETKQMEENLKQKDEQIKEIKSAL